MLGKHYGSKHWTYILLMRCTLARKFAGHEIPSPILQVPDLGGVLKSVQRADGSWAMGRACAAKSSALYII